VVVGCARQPAVETTSIQVGGLSLDVLVADTPAERQVGLTGVEEIPGGADGMLFVYEAPAPVRYWMLDVPIALDIWFFDPDGALIGGTEMAPCPTRLPPMSRGSWRRWPVHTSSMMVL
jgi:uncharacterized membrane protein (UPF0127 family)